MIAGLERMEYNKASHCSDFWERGFDLCLVTRLADMMGHDDAEGKNYLPPRRPVLKALRARPLGEEYCVTNTTACTRG